MIILGTKYCVEIGSAESHPIARRWTNPLFNVLWRHSLLILIGLTGIGWLALFLRMDPDAKWGQVVGNLVSEWVQMGGLVFLTKRLNRTRVGGKQVNAARNSPRGIILGQNPPTKMKSVLPALGAAIFFTAASMQGGALLQSGPRHTALLELFTSEGCSSCPPAEARLSALKNDPELWRSFVPLAFHVDYWDRLGWRDRYSLASFTARQNSYAQLWHSESVYTPAFVLDGKELKTLPENFRQPNENSGVLTATSDDSRSWTITFAPSPGMKGPWDAHVAWLGADISSQIDAGENGGRKLEHDFVVLGIEQASIPEGMKQTKVSLASKGLIQAAPRHAVAIWVTHHDALPSVQATGGWISLR